jgi:hypothetical protein
MKKNQKKKTLPKKSLLILPAVCVLIVAALIYAYYRSNTNSASSVSTASQTAKPYATGSSATAQPTKLPTATANPDPNVPGGSTGSSSSNQVGLDAPSGTFVSNHGSIYQPVVGTTTEESTCTTTAGATCQIRFTQGSTTETLDASQATATKDSQNGTTSWTWTPNQVGLTAGTWSVAAVASLSGQTKNTLDQVALTIGS